MPSRPEPPTRAYVWTWLTGATEPVVAGRLDGVGELLTFTYGQSYLDRSEAVSLYLPELPLERGRIDPRGNLSMPGVIEDAGPDSWGQRIVMRRVLGRSSGDEDPAVLTPLTYLLESGSDRIGALDFQASAKTYRSRNGDTASLEDMTEAAEKVERGEPLPPSLDAALLHGTSVGGARPKALLNDSGRRLIAKFSSTTDTYEVVKGEFIAMELATRAGLNAANVELQQVMSKDVLLVERFDRGLTAEGETRRTTVSALTILGLDAFREGRYATYYALAQEIRERFTDPQATLRELFSRISFNILVGNIDDHARNHAAFWDGERSDLTLTPAYDITPQVRTGFTAQQIMAFAPGPSELEGVRDSQLERLVEAADRYLLPKPDAREIIDHQIETIATQWDEVADAARVTDAEGRTFRRRQILNPYAFEGYSTPNPW